MTTGDVDQRLRELSFLESVVRITASSTDFSELVDRVIRQTTEVTGMDVCSLYLWEPAERTLVLAATNGLSQAGVGRARLALGEGVTGWVAAQRQYMAVRDVRYEPCFQWLPGVDQDRLLAMLSVPIVSHGALVGVMNLQRAEAHEFAAQEIEFAQALAAQLASMLELTMLHKQRQQELAAERDALRRALAAQAGDVAFSTMLMDDFGAPLARLRSRLEEVRVQLPSTFDVTYAEMKADVARMERIVAELGQI